jgi:hypothetical protein
MANILPRERQVEIIAALVEGCSIRAVERLTGVHRDTIMRLGVQVGTGCARIHDSLMRGLYVARIECDEVWSFVGKKQGHKRPTDAFDLGDTYVFLGMAAVGKAIISYRVGKRSRETTRLHALSRRRGHGVRHGLQLRHRGQALPDGRRRDPRSRPSLQPCRGSKGNQAPGIR